MAELDKILSVPGPFLGPYFLYIVTGTVEREGLVGLQPAYHFFAGIYYLGLQLTWRKFLKIIGLCPKRWTVRASCFRPILENYALLMEEWDVFLSE